LTILFTKALKDIGVTSINVISDELILEVIGYSIRSKKDKTDLTNFIISIRNNLDELLDDIELLEQIILFVSKTGPLFLKKANTKNLFLIVNGVTVLKKGMMS